MVTWLLPSFNREKGDILQIWAHLLSSGNFLIIDIYFIYLFDFSQLFIIFISAFFFLLYNIVLVLPYIDMNQPWVYMCSPSWNPLLPPSPSHPSGSSQCTSPKHPVSALNIALGKDRAWMPRGQSDIDFKRLLTFKVIILMSSKVNGFYISQGYQFFYLTETYSIFLGKELTANWKDIRDVDSIPGSGRSFGGVHDNPLQDSCPENP